MIRHILRDLFPGRTQVGALRQRVHELERENKAIGEAYARTNTYNARLHDECERLEAENADLRKRALRPTPTPGEARMLEIVRANPGQEAMELGTLMRFPDGEWHTSLEDYAGVSRCADYLTGLHKKSLVRRERSGNTYRYWVTT